MVLGELCALAAAASYAGSSTMFSYTVKDSSPTRSNFLRGAICSVIFFGILFTTSDEIIPNNTLHVYSLVVVSGVLGIGVGDTFFLKAIEKMGARNTLLIESLSPIFTGIVSYFYSGETLGLTGWIGMGITTYGVYIVINEQEKEDSKVSSDQKENILNKFSPSEELTSKSIEMSLLKGSQFILPTTIHQTIEQTSWKSRYQCAMNNNLFLGILFGFASNACQALGLVLSHSATSVSTFSSLQMAYMRLVSGTIAVAITMIANKNQIFEWPWKTRQLNTIFACQLMLSTFIGVWAQQLALVYTTPEVAQTIIATAPLIQLVIGYFRGETIKYQYIFGSIIAVVGIGIITWL